MLTAIARVVIHHSASPTQTKLEEIRRWHMARGYKDVGYHYVIEGSGEIRIGRRLPEIGAHVAGRNLGSIGVCVTGNNTVAGEEWDVRQGAALKSLLAAMRLLWPDLEVVGHRDLAPTLCPGVDVLALYGDGRTPTSDG